MSGKDGFHQLAAWQSVEALSGFPLAHAHCDWNESDVRALTRPVPPPPHRRPSVDKFV